MDVDDPIVAVSSPPGRSHRGLVRVTGRDIATAFPRILDRQLEPRRLTACRLFLPPLPRGEGRGEGVSGLNVRHSPMLPCLTLFHPAAKSFTAQDTLELQIPGNPALLDRITHTLLSALRDASLSARLAEPGEFTQRAFLAGRIDLTRAEGIAATIGAVSDAQLHAARLLRTGRLGQWSTDLVDRLAHLLALVEAGIDFVDQDDVVPIAPAPLDTGLAALEKDLADMLAKSRAWSALESLPWVVLAGPPNVGKSTLFNALLGHERAVVSDIAGTTRDVLTEPLRITSATGEPAEVMLVDIAGLDTPTSALDTSMQQSARAALDRAELILLLHACDDTEPITPPHTAAPTLSVRTKCDELRKKVSGTIIENKVPDTFVRGAIRVSAVTGEGIAELRERIAAQLGDRAVTVAGEMLALQPRHRDELLLTAAAVSAVRALLAGQRDRRALEGMELIADRLREALDHLGALGGQMTPDDVIGKIFATFCIGK